MERAGPLIRANYAKLTIGGIKRLPPQKADAIFAAMGEELRAEIREAGMLEWIPANSFFTVIHAIERVLEPSKARAFWKDSMLRSLEGRLLAPLRIGAIALYGKRPGSLVRGTPLAWKLVAKDCGTSHVSQPNDTTAVLAFDDLPPGARETLGFVHILAGGCEAAISYVGAKGYVVTHAEELALGKASVDAHWEA